MSLLHMKLNNYCFRPNLYLEINQRSGMAGEDIKPLLVTSSYPNSDKYVT